MKRESTANLYDILSLVFVGLTLFVCACALLLLLRVVQPPGPLAPRAAPTNMPLAALPTDTNTPTPSKTPTPSRTPIPTRTLIPTATTAPSATPRPPATVAPTLTPQPTLESGAPTAQPTGTPAQLVKLVVARKNLPLGSSISAADVTLCAWPANLVPLSAYSVTAGSDGTDEVKAVVGKVIRIDLPGGFPLLTTGVLTSDQASRLGITAKPVPAGANVACPKNLARTAQVVIAAQAMPRGFKIPERAVTLDAFPAEIVPKNALTDLKLAVGKTVCIDLPRGAALLTQHVGTVPPGTAAPNVFNVCTTR
jgi:Flp pilus assembly protein CpaB